MIAASVLSPSHTTISGGSIRSTSPAPSSTIHHRADATGFNRERVHQPPVSALGCPCIGRGIEQGATSFRIATTHTDLTGVERANHQPHAVIFGGAQSTTINGGISYHPRRRISYIARMILAYNEARLVGRSAYIIVSDISLIIRPRLDVHPFTSTRREVLVPAHNTRLVTNLPPHFHFQKTHRNRRHLA
jgi:hypothetical protein